MLEEFFAGKCAVYLDKEKPDLAKAFYDLIEDKVKGCSYPWGFTMIDYFLSKGSGPFFFMQGRRINGGTLKYIQESKMITYPVEEILEEDLNVINIREDDIKEMFI